MIHSLTNIWSVEIQTARQVARSGVSISSRVGLVQDVLSLIFWFFSGNFKKLSNIWPEHGAFSFMVFQIAFVRIVAWHTALRTEKGNTFWYWILTLIIVNYLMFQANWKTSGQTLLSQAPSAVVQFAVQLPSGGKFLYLLEIILFVPE